MPIYDYVCSTCATRTEFIHGIDAPTPRFCPACGAEGTLRKAIVPPAVHFKGSGWAKKDRSSASAAKAKAGAAASGEAGSGGAKGGSSDGAAASSTDGAGSTSAGSASAAGSDVASGSRTAKPAGEG